MIDPEKLSEMMSQAQSMQSEMQRELESATAVGEAGGGMVKVTLTGTGQVTAVSIEPTVVDPNDINMLEDLVRAAFNAAQGQMEQVRMEHAKTMASKMGIPPGMF